MTRPEPAGLATLIKESISSVVKLLVIFGLVAMDEVQLAALLLVVDNFLAVASWVYTRARVTPVDDPQLPTGTRVRVTDAENNPTHTTTVQ